MCIIVDVNTLTPVFDDESQLHDDFQPVKVWILEGRGKIVYGGSKYLNELSRTKYLRLFGELRKAEKAVYVESNLVDKMEEKVLASVTDEDFDDSHLVALLLVSKCKLVCSLDERAYPFFTHENLFKPASKRPKIYRQQSNKDLLCQKNIADICLPCDPTTKAQRKQILL